MKQHTLVGIFGSEEQGDQESLNYGDAAFLSLIPINSSASSGALTALKELNDKSIYPTEIGLDLLVLAEHVYAADTRISRLKESQDSWTREITLVVPVSVPLVWENVSSLLVEILNFLTGDKWTLVFRCRPKKFENMVPQKPEETEESQLDGVSLFSGGLDSLIGAIDSLAQGERPLLVSHAAEGAVSNSQNKCFELLKKEYSYQSFDRFRFWFSPPSGLFSGVESEDSTRGRSFLFFALGVFAATGLSGSIVLKVPENGLISLNVPLDSLRLGSHSTRTTHPFYIARWNELLLKLAINCKIENPYWNQTKGEMVENCSNQQLLNDSILHSMSCSSPAKSRWRGKSAEHCGYCLPCLIRRASIEHAKGINNDPTKYTQDIRSIGVIDTMQAMGKQIRSFQLAARRLKGNPGLAPILIHKSGSLKDEGGRLDQLAGVYLRGMEEVERLISSVKTKPIGK